MTTPTTTDPSRLNPRARAERALEIAVGGFDAQPSFEVLREFHNALSLVEQGKLDFQPPSRLWDFVRATVGAIVRKDRDEHSFQSEMRALALRTSPAPTSLDRIFQLPAGTFAGVATADVGRIAAIVLTHYAPQLGDLIPEPLRPKTATYEVAFPEEALRKIVREELEAARQPTIEFRPGERVVLPKELGFEVPSPQEAAEAPEEKEPVTRAEEEREVEAPPVTPLPQAAPRWPSLEQIRSFSRAELTATLRIWKQLYDTSRARPPDDVYQAVRRRYEQVFKFPAPEIFPVAAPPPPPAFVAKVEHLPPAPAPSPPVPPTEGRPPVPLTEKYRPRTLDQVIGNPRIVLRLKQLAHSTEPLPAQMIFTGPPGLGKTSVAQAFARDYLVYQLTRRHADFLIPEDRPLPSSVYFEANAAMMKDDPTGFITNRVLPFLRSAGLVSGQVKKFMVFDDVAQLSPENQKLLLRPLEQFARGNTVIWISNEPHKQLPALQSRAAGFIFAFVPLSRDDIVKGLQRVAEGEAWTSLPNYEGTLERIAQAAQGDLRAAIGMLQAAWQEHLIESGA